MEGFLTGTELILRHTNAVKELPSKGLKAYSPNHSWLEKRQIENQLDEKFSFIDAERIEKSNNISQAKWIDDFKKAKVTKKIGKFWETFGHHSDNEDWLFPEEALFLMENCELQLFYNTIPLSLEDFYRLVFHEGVYSLEDYRVYSHLSRAGFKVVRHNPSVSATHYEKQVKLDTVMQRQRRSPQSNVGNVTVIDDDISILEDATSTVEKTIKSSVHESSKGTPDDPILIEIDDEPEVKAEIEIRTIDSDSDSDVVCISSPTFASDVNSRQWYPPIHKCLKKPMETLIDLCDESDDTDNKSLIKNKIDLIRASKVRILSNIPSVKSGVSIIPVPDIRLLPPNIVPKHSEYRVNLSIKEDDSNIDYSYRNNFNYHSPNYNRNNTHSQNDELKIMAENMISEAKKIIAYIGRSEMSGPHPTNYFNGHLAEQNPNELWNMTQTMRKNTPAFSPNYISGNFRQRPFFQRRRFPRRRGPHSCGYSNRPRVPYRLSYSPSKQYDMNRNASPSQPTASMSEEVVILSDDDVIKKEPEAENVRKRKANHNDDLSKRMKTEPEDSSPGDSSSTEDEPEKDVFVKKEVLNKNVKVENDTTKIKVKTESSLVTVDIKSEPNSSNVTTLSTPVNIKCESTSEKITPESSTTNVTIRPSESLSIASGISSSVEPNFKLSPADVNPVETKHILKESQSQEICLEKPVVENSTSSKENELCSEKPDHPLKDSDEGPSNISDINNSETGSIEHFNDTDEQHECIMSPSNDEITSWKEYKNHPFDLDSERGDSDVLIKYGQCSSYGDVLSALQIFKKIDVKKISRTFKISFDVYLPERNFKKSLKVLPNFRVIVMMSNEDLPSSLELNGLKMQYQDDIPFLFSVVFDETIAFYLYDTVTIDTFYE